MHSVIKGEDGSIMPSNEPGLEMRVVAAPENVRGAVLYTAEGTPTPGVRKRRDKLRG